MKEGENETYSEGITKRPWGPIHCEILEDREEVCLEKTLVYGFDKRAHQKREGIQGKRGAGERRGEGHENSTLELLELRQLQDSSVKVGTKTGVWLKPLRKCAGRENRQLRREL